MSKHCGSCGSTADDDDSFCSECGELFTVTPVTVALAPVTTAVVPAQPMSPAPTWSGPATYTGDPTGTYGPTSTSSTYGAPAQPTGRFFDPVTGLPLASWGRRLAARLLDGFILGIPTTVVSIAYLVALSHSLNNTSPYDSASTKRALAELLLGWFAIPLIFNLLAFAYYIGFIGGAKGQTLGMRIVSIQVKDASCAQTSIGFGRSFMRMMVQVTFGIVLVPLLLDYLAPLWTARRQCWHDMAVSSIVVKIA